MQYQNIKKEEELKNKISRDYFSDYDCNSTDYNIDFWVTDRKKSEKILLWAEAKRTKNSDIATMFTQLVLTIGKNRVFDTFLPPAFVGVFDAEKIVFLLYDKIHHLFHKNDFNWKITPSNQKTKEFVETKSLIKDILESEKHEYNFDEDDIELRFFIKNNLAKSTEKNKIQIDEINVEAIFHRWQKEVKPHIDLDFKDKKYQFLESSFFIADLFVDDKDTITISDDVTIKEDLLVVFRNKSYEVYKDKADIFGSKSTIDIKNETAFANFWKRYKRPPLKQYQDYILNRKDLFVPADFRQRKGAFFTPTKWVELSQKYISDVLGKNWQEEYYVWDCAAGTGNLLIGLYNSRNIYASTLDQGDVTAMKELNKSTQKMFENHIFQFDFLNDDFFDTEQTLYDEHRKKVETRKNKSKLPQSLQEILKDSEKRKKLVIYINPPYAEAGNSNTMMNTKQNNNQKAEEDKTKKHKSKVATDNRAYYKYRKEIGKAGNELFAQFLYKIYREIPQCILANFSTLKNLQGSNFTDFREKFRAKLEKIFMVPGNTFDNVNGDFPIGFFVWNTEKKEKFNGIIAQVYNENGYHIKDKTIHNYDNDKRINQWIVNYKEKDEKTIGFLSPARNDFKNKKLAYIINTNEKQPDKRGNWINSLNFIPSCVYLAIHHCTKRNWLNHEDQFLYPKDSWADDIEFHYDCLVFTLFHEKNRISVKDGVNHWTPFTEREVGTKEPFKSTFMADFITGKIKKSNGNGNIFEPPKVENGVKCTFSPQAQDVFDAGKELWRYYHLQKDKNPATQIDFNVNAGLYDIREYFQGRNEKTKRMNSTSKDEKYNDIMEILREKLTILAEKIAEKVYQHGFLK